MTACALFAWCQPGLAADDFLAFEVRRDGKVEKEGRAPGFSAEKAHNVKSLSKSILAILVGIARADGLVKDLDENVAPLLWPGRSLPELSWRQLLSMQSGFPSTSGKSYGRWVQSADWVEYFSKQARIKRTEMSYSTGDAHLLAAALRKKLGRSLAAYAEEKLFSPLGIKGVSWTYDPQGREFGGNDLSLSFNSVSRIGQLLLQQGKWEGKAVVPADWIRQMWSLQAKAPAEFVEFQVRGYGYFWWLVKIGNADAACALGYGAQILCLFPEQKMQVTVFSRIPPRPKHVRANWVRAQSFLKQVAGN